MEQEKLINFISIKLELWETYHNHKENMANAGFLVQLSLFGAIISEGLWPPKWVSNVINMPELGTFLVYFLLWFLIHYYTRWQLINKRIAAMYYAGFDQAYLYFSMNELSQEDLKICQTEAHAICKAKDFLSKIIYIPGGFTKMDASLKGLPNFIAKEIKDKFESGSGAETLEILVTYTSFLLMFLTGIKIFMG